MSSSVKATPGYINLNHHGEDIHTLDMLFSVGQKEKMGV